MSSDPGIAITNVDPIVSTTSDSAAGTTTLPILSSFPSNPLTTTFTPPPACSGVYQSDVAIVDVDSSCLPSGFKSAQTDYFSPGIACPSGYYTACHDNKGVESITTVTCCPVRQSTYFSCVNPADLQSVWATLYCTWQAGEAGDPVTITASSDGTTSTQRTTMTSPEGINAFGVRMVYQATDTATGTGATRTGADGAASTTDSDGDSSSGGSHLGTGGIVALAVVLPIAAIFLAGLFARWRKRRQQAQGAPVPISDPSKPTHDSSPGQNGYFPHQYPAELPHTQTPAELSNAQYYAELPVEQRR